MRNFLNEIYKNSSVNVFQCMTGQFCYNDLVWRHVNIYRRTRAKQDGTLTGQHRELQKYLKEAALGLEVPSIKGYSEDSKKKNGYVRHSRKAEIKGRYVVFGDLCQ